MPVRSQQKELYPPLDDNLIFENRLFNALAKRGKSFGDLSRYMNLPTDQFRYKVENSNNEEFTESEACQICEFMNLTVDEADYLFSTQANVYNAEFRKRLHNYIEYRKAERFMKEYRAQGQVKTPSRESGSGTR